MTIEQLLAATKNAPAATDRELIRMLFDYWKLTPSKNK